MRTVIGIVGIALLVAGGYGLVATYRTNADGEDDVPGNGDNRGSVRALNAVLVAAGVVVLVLALVH